MPAYSSHTENIPITYLYKKISSSHIYIMGVARTNQQNKRRESYLSNLSFWQWPTHNCTPKPAFTDRKILPRCHSPLQSSAISDCGTSQSTQSEFSRSHCRSYINTPFLMFFSTESQKMRMQKPTYQELTSQVVINGEGCEVHKGGTNDSYSFRDSIVYIVGEVEEAPTIVPGLRKERGK